MNKIINVSTKIVSICVVINSIAIKIGTSIINKINEIE